MPIKFSCDKCGSVLRVAEQHIGKQAKCPKCGDKCTVPAESQAEPAAAASPSPFPAAAPPVAPPSGFPFVRRTCRRSGSTKHIAPSWCRWLTGSRQFSLLNTDGPQQQWRATLQHRHASAVSSARHDAVVRLDHVCHWHYLLHHNHWCDYWLVATLDG